MSSRGLPLGGEEDVAGFDVAMDELGTLPAVFQGARGVADDAQGVEQRERAALQPVAEGLALDEFQGKVVERFLWSGADAMEDRVAPRGAMIRGRFPAVRGKRGKFWFTTRGKPSFLHAPRA